MNPEQYSVLNTERAQYILLQCVLKMNPEQYSVLNTDRAQYNQLLKCSKDEP